MKTTRCRAFTIHFSTNCNRSSQLLRTFDEGGTDFLEVTEGGRHVSVSYVRNAPELQKPILMPVTPAGTQVINLGGVDTRPIPTVVIKTIR